jgi:hypothetical protein
MDMLPWRYVLEPYDNVLRIWLAFSHSLFFNSSANDYWSTVYKMLLEKDENGIKKPKILPYKLFFYYVGLH